jgi:predicted homoserine dehydrogenase-like protein
LQIASTIGRAVVLEDATVAPTGGPRCEVVAVAKRDLRAGERIDGIGGFCVYGLIENAPAARQAEALPMGLCEGSTLRRDVPCDTVLTTNDVALPPERLSDRLWLEQRRRWPDAPTRGDRALAAKERAAV